MEGAKIENTIFEMVYAQDVPWSLKNVYLRNVQFIKCKTSGTNAVAAILSDCLFDRSNFWKSIFVGTSIYDSKIIHSGFNQSEMKQSKIVNTALVASRFRKSVFSHSSFTGCTVSDCLLENADFRNAEFNSSVFENNHIGIEYRFQTIFKKEEK
jgi:uncharacterized protein YjbI with pentapeptide repeats